jgi:serine/threonine protein kinase
MNSRIGRYQLLSELGEGGFGKVYLAEDPVLAGRRVAIKVLTAPHDPTQRIRFKNEAVAAANLRHPNIVTILEYGEENDKPYIVMEYLEGQDLSKRLAKGPPLTLFQKVNILHQIADGLHAAHSSPKAIVHRDVKPANIMLLSGGGVKIMDFGIARLSDSGTRLTSANILIGSVGYMAPEQFVSGTSDALSDIWSFGVLSYELLTGQHPFSASDITQIMYRVTSVEPPPVDSVIPNCSKELASVISKAMSKNRDQRYRSLEDAVFDLNSVLVELRQAEAEDILKKAEQHYAAGQLELALQSVRDALEVDSNFRSARIFRDKLNTELRLQSSRAKLGETLRAVEESLSRGDLAGAVKYLEIACQLDPSDRPLAARLEQLRAAKQKRDEAEQVVEAGKRHLEAGELTQAARALERAVHVDAAAPGIQDLGSRLQTAQARQAQASEIRSAVAEAEAAYRSRKFDAAIAALEQVVQKYPAEQTVAAKLNQYRDHAQRLREDIGRIQRTIQSLLQSNQLAQAKAVCMDAVGRYPDQPEFRSLWSEIEQREEALRRAADQARLAAERQQNIDRLLADMRRALGSGNLEDAAKTAAHAIANYPEHSDFHKLSREVQDAMARKTEYRPAPVAPAPVITGPSQVQPTAATLQATAAAAPPSGSRGLIFAVLGLTALVLLGAAGYVAINRISLTANTTTPRTLTASPKSLTFSFEPGKDPSPEQFVIRPGGQFSVAAPDWVTVVQTGGPDSTLLTVGLRAEQITASRSGKIEILGEGGAKETVDVAVVFTPPRVAAADPPAKKKAEEKDGSISAKESKDKQVGIAKADLTKGGQGKRPVEVSRPVDPPKPADNPKPVIETPRPVVETPKPAVENPKPVENAKPAALPPIIRLTEYFGPQTGTITWSGQLDNQGRAAIDGASATPGALVRGSLAGVERLEIGNIVPAGVRIVEAPSEQNRWRKLVFESDDRTIRSVTITWQIRRR